MERATATVSGPTPLTNRNDNAALHLLWVAWWWERKRMLGSDGSLLLQWKAEFQIWTMTVIQIHPLFLDLPDLFKSISFLNRTSVWQAFQGARKIALSWGYSIVGDVNFAKEGCKSQWEDIKKRCGYPTLGWLPLLCIYSLKDHKMQHFTSFQKIFIVLNFN